MNIAYRQPTAKEPTGGGLIVFNSSDWTSSLAPNYSASTLSIQKGKQLAAMRSMNPFRNYGYLTPGFLAADVTNVSEVSEVCLVAVVNGTNAYLVTAGAKLQKLDITSTGSLTAGFHTITPASGNSVVGSDCVIYTAKVGGALASRMFYSYTSSAVWDVGTFDFTSTFDDDFMSTAPATPLAAPYVTGGKGYSHPLVVGDDDILYIGDRNFVHAYDGQNAADNDGKFFPAVLTLPAGYIIKSFVKVDQGLLIFTYLENPVGTSSFYYGDARAWLWNYNELDITYSYSLHDNYVTESFTDALGRIGCFTQGRPNDVPNNKPSAIQFFEGNQFVKKAAFIDNIPVRGGVDIVGNSVQWNSSGKVYSYGSPVTGVEAGLNQIGEFTGTTSGFLKTLTSSIQWGSSGATTSGGLQRLNDNYSSATLLATGLAEPVFPIYKKGRIKNVKVRFMTTTTSANSRALNLSLADRNGTTSQVLSNITDISGQSGMVIDKNTDINDAPFIKFDSLKCIPSYDLANGTTDAPIIDAVEVSYENINE